MMFSLNTATLIHLHIVSDSSVTHVRDIHSGTHKPKIQGLGGSNACVRVFGGVIMGCNNL